MQCDIFFSSVYVPSPAPVANFYCLVFVFVTIPIIIFLVQPQNFSAAFKSIVLIFFNYCMCR